MQKMVFVVLVAVFFLVSCQTTRYFALDGDYNNMAIGKELNDAELEKQALIFKDAKLVERFDSDQLAPGLQLLEHGKLLPERGDLLSLSPGNNAVGMALQYRPQEEFSSVLVCWNMTGSNRGHLILWARIPGFGMPTFFNNDGSTGAHIHLDSRGGNAEHLDHVEDGRRGYVIQEIRIEGAEIVMLINGSVFNRYKMDKPRKFSDFSIGNNLGGEGYIDYIVVK
jgi:hypothetical protein